MNVGKQDQTFAAVVQHELRTPANAIIGYSRLLIEQASEEDAEVVQGIHQAGVKLLALVDRVVGDDLAALRSHPARVRHDLAGLMHVIVGYTDLLPEEPLGALDGNADLDHLRDATKRMHDSVDRITRSMAEPTQNGAPAPISLPDDKLVRAAIATLQDAPVVDRRKSEARLLVVDDEPANRDLLSRHLRHEGYSVELAVDGREALELVGKRSYDLVLTDLIMPGLDGYQLLAALKSDPAHRHLPVLVISAYEDVESVARCIELGADDYLPKTFNPVLLRARVRASLERKRLHDREARHLEEIRTEREKSERLLRNVFPAGVLERLKIEGEPLAESFEEVTVLFADIVGFTAYASRHCATTVVARLNEIFAIFDCIVAMRGVEKIKTIGDAYMLAGGVPEPCPDHAARVVQAGLDMLDATARLARGREDGFEIRIGVHTGPVVAGVIGRSRFGYDLWGDSVNVASRLQTLGTPGYIQISESTRRRLGDRFAVETVGELEVKGKGRLMAYRLDRP